MVLKKYGCFVLTNLHKAHLWADNLLDDIHVGAAQELITKQFPHMEDCKHGDAKFRDDEIIFR